METNNMVSRIDRMKTEDIIEIVNSSNSIGECLEKIGISNQNVNRKRFKKRLIKENIKTNFSREYDRNLIGEKIGTLVVIKQILSTGKKKWKCKCNCGREKVFPEYKLISGIVKSCGCQQYKTGEKNHNWCGIGLIPGRVLCNIKCGAKRRNLDYSLTNEYLLELYKSQNGKCALSGMDIDFKGSYITASLDRIDNKLGYIKGNVQWVHKDINRMKNIFDNNYFIEMCKKVSLKNCT